MVIALIILGIAVVNSTLFFSPCVFPVWQSLPFICAAIAGIWFLCAWLLHRVCGVGFKKALSRDALTYLVTFLFFIYFAIPGTMPLTSLQRFRIVTGIVYVSLVYAKLCQFLYYYRKNRLSLPFIRPRQLGLVLLCIVFVFYAALTLRTAQVIAPTGDEPFYLLSAHSLIRDHDLDISNNHRLGQWKSFMPEGYQLSLWQSARPDGRVYLEDRMLFVALITVPYLLGGFMGVSLFLAFVSSLLVAGMYFFMVYAGFEPRRSFLTALLVACTQPMLSMHARVYHNCMGALFILAAFLSLTYKPKHARYAFFSLFLIMALPWLHISYVAFSVTLFCLFAYRYRLSKTILISGITACVMDAGAFFLYRAHIKAGVPASAAIAQYQLTPHIYRSLCALVFDQEAGLFFYAPVFIFFFAGLANALCIDKALRFSREVFFVLAGYFIVQGSLPAFGGGYDTGRSIIPALPFMAIFLRRFFEDDRCKAGVYIVGGFSLVWGYLLTALPWLAVNHQTGRNVVFRLCARLGFDIGKYFPSFYLPGQERYLVCLLLIAAMAFLGMAKEKRFVWRCE